MTLPEVPENLPEAAEEWQLQANKARFMEQMLVVREIPESIRRPEADAFLEQLYQIYPTIVSPVYRYAVTDTLINLRAYVDDNLTNQEIAEQNGAPSPHAVAVERRQFVETFYKHGYGAPRLRSMLFDTTGLSSVVSQPVLEEDHLTRVRILLRTIDNKIDGQLLSRHLAGDNVDTTQQEFWKDAEHFAAAIRYAGQLAAKRRSDGLKPSPHALSQTETDMLMALLGSMRGTGIKSRRISDLAAESRRRHPDNPVSAEEFKDRVGTSLQKIADAVIGVRIARQASYERLIRGYPEQLG